MLHLKLDNCRLKDLDGIYVISQMLAHYFPKPDQFITGIYELLLNAVEHGNLNIGFEAKTELLRQGRWQQEIARRLALPEYAAKAVKIRLSHNDHECRLAIADQGNGFAWKNYTSLDAGSQRPNGRGLWIAFNSQFDRIQFNRAGNEVICVASYGDSLAKKAEWQTPLRMMETSL